MSKRTYMHEKRARRLSRRLARTTTGLAFSRPANQNSIFSHVA